MIMGRRWVTRTVRLVLVLLVWAPCGAQTVNSVLTGQVVDTSAKPMPGVIVTVSAKSKAMAPVEP